MEVWKIVFHFILEIFHSIPFWHIPYRNFRSIPFHFPFHSTPCSGCRFCIIIIIVAFYSNGCSQVENPEAPDFEKIASASGFFSTLSLPSLLPLPTSFIKVLPLPQKINRFHRFRFQLPLPHPCLQQNLNHLFLDGLVSEPLCKSSFGSAVYTLACGLIVGSLRSFFASSSFRRCWVAPLFNQVALKMKSNVVCCTDC